MKKIISCLLILCLMGMCKLPVNASETVPSGEEEEEVIRRIAARNIYKTVSCGNGTSAVIYGMYTYDSSGNIINADLQVTSDYTVLNFSYEIQGNNIWYCLGLAGGYGSRIGFLL